MPNKKHIKPFNHTSNSKGTHANTLGQYGDPVTLFFLPLCEQNGLKTCRNTDTLTGL